MLPDNFKLGTYVCLDDRGLTAVRMPTAIYSLPLANELNLSRWASNSFGSGIFNIEHASTTSPLSITSRRNQCFRGLSSRTGSHQPPKMSNRGIVAAQKRMLPDNFKLGTYVCLDDRTKNGTHAYRHMYATVCMQASKQASKQASMQACKQACMHALHIVPIYTSIQIS
jgi:hypothetical protein